MTLIGDSEMTQKVFPDVIDTDNFSPETASLYDFLRNRVIGQDEALQSVARGFAIYNAGLGDGRRPIATLLFTGPTGTGKTMTAEEVSKYIIGDDFRPPITRIQCARFQERHRISELIGSPQGYVRSDDPGLLWQLNIEDSDFWRRATPFLKKELKGKASKDKIFQVLTKAYEKFYPFKSVILFDEIEKAHPDLHDMLLHIIDDGELGTNHQGVTLFSNSVIILTSNVGGRRQQDILENKGLRAGFKQGSEDLKTDDLVYDETIKLIKQFFPPELVGRLESGISVFRTLDRESIAKILDNMLQEAQDRLVRRQDSGIPVILHYSPEFKDAILDCNKVRQYGVRPLRALVEKEVVMRVANAVGSGEIRECDEILFTVDTEKRIVVRRKARPVPVKCRISTAKLFDDDGESGVAIVPVRESSDE